MSERIELSGLTCAKKEFGKAENKEKPKVYHIVISGRCDSEKNVVIQRSLK